MAKVNRRGHESSRFTPPGDIDSLNEGPASSVAMSSSASYTIVTRRAAKNNLAISEAQAMSIQIDLNESGSGVPSPVTPIVHSETSLLSKELPTFALNNGCEGDGEKVGGSCGVLSHNDGIVIETAERGLGVKLESIKSFTTIQIDRKEMILMNLRRSILNLSKLIFEWAEYDGLISIFDSCTATKYGGLKQRLARSLLSIVDPKSTFITADMKFVKTYGTKINHSNTTVCKSLHEFRRFLIECHKQGLDVSEQEYQFKCAEKFCGQLMNYYKNGNPFAWDRDGRRDLLNVNMLRLDGDSIHYGDEKPVREQYIVEDSSSLVNIRKLLSELYHIVSDMSEYLAIKQILDQDTGGGISEEEECDLIMDCLMFQNPNNLLCVRKTSDLSIFVEFFEHVKSRIQDSVQTYLSYGAGSTLEDETIKKHTAVARNLVATLDAEFWSMWVVWGPRNARELREDVEGVLSLLEGLLEKVNPCTYGNNLEDTVATTRPPLPLGHTSLLTEDSLVLLGQSFPTRLCRSNSEDDILFNTPFSPNSNKSLQFKDIEHEADATESQFPTSSQDFHNQTPPTSIQPLSPLSDLSLQSRQTQEESSPTEASIQRKRHAEEDFDIISSSDKKRIRTSTIIHPPSQEVIERRISPRRKSQIMPLRCKLCGQPILSACHCTQAPGEVDMGMELDK